MNCTTSDARSTVCPVFAARNSHVFRRPCSALLPPLFIFPLLSNDRSCFLLASSANWPTIHRRKRVRHWTARSEASTLVRSPDPSSERSGLAEARRARVAVAVPGGMVDPAIFLESLPLPCRYRISSASTFFHHYPRFHPIYPPVCFHDVNH